MHAVLYTDRDFWNCVSIALITVSKTGVSVHFLCVLLLSMNFKIYWVFCKAEKNIKNMTIPVIYRNVF